MSMYVPRLDPVTASARVGDQHQADIAKATLMIMAPDGTRHEVDVALYVSAMDDGHLCLDVDTYGLERDIRVVFNDDEDGAVDIESEA